MHALYDRIPSPASSPYTCSLQSRSRNYWWRICTHTYTVSLFAILSYTVCMGGWLSAYRVSYLSHSSRSSLAVSSATYSVSCTLFSMSAYVCMYGCLDSGNGKWFPVPSWSIGMELGSQRRQPSCPALSITAPRQRLSYPDLPCPALLSYSICVSVVFLSNVSLI